MLSPLIFDLLTLWWLFFLLETSDDMSATTTESDKEMKEETDGSSLGQLTIFFFCICSIVADFQHLLNCVMSLLNSV